MQGLSAVFVAGLAVYGLFFTSLPEDLARQMIASGNTQIADLQRQRQALSEQRDQLSQRISDNVRALGDQQAALASSAVRLERSRLDEKAARDQAGTLSGSLAGAEKRLSELQAAADVMQKDSARELCDNGANRYNRLWLDGPIGEEITYLRLTQFEDSGAGNTAAAPPSGMADRYKDWAAKHPLGFFADDDGFGKVYRERPDEAASIYLYNRPISGAEAQAYDRIVSDETSAVEGSIYSHSRAALDRQRRRAVTPAMAELLRKLDETLEDRKDALSGPIRLPAVTKEEARTKWPPLIPPILRRIEAADEYLSALDRVCKAYTE